MLFGAGQNPMANIMQCYLVQVKIHETGLFAGLNLCR